MNHSLCRRARWLSPPSPRAAGGGRKLRPCFPRTTSRGVCVCVCVCVCVLGVVFVAYTSSSNARFLSGQKLTALPVGLVRQEEKRCVGVSSLRMLGFIFVIIIVVGYAMYLRLQHHVRTGLSEQTSTLVYGKRTYIRCACRSTYIRCIYIRTSRGVLVFFGIVFFVVAYILIF